MSKSKPRVLMIIHNLRPGPTGGAENAAERLAVNLVKLGYPVHILTSRPFPEAPAEEDYLGVKIHRVSFGLPYFIWSNGQDTFQYLGEMRKQFDVIHCHQAFGHAMVGVIAARVFGKKCIIKTACGGDTWGDFITMQNFDGYADAMTIIKQADAFISISHDIEKELPRYGLDPEKIVYIPNGVDTEQFKMRREHLIKEPVVFLQTSRLDRQKGIDLTLQAAKLLLQRGFDGRFSVQFYGAQYSYEFDFPAMARDLGVDTVARFMGFTRDNYSIYDNADVFLLPSRAEGLSNSLLEAMSMEMPAIVSRVSGNVDVVSNDRDGVLISTESVEELADAMQKCIQQPDWALQLGKQARQTIKDHFSIENVAAQYGKLYDRLCGYQAK